MKLPARIFLLTQLIFCLALFSSAGFAGVETVTFFHNDALGSPVAATDENGDVIWRETYRPYGTRTVRDESAQNDEWFTGKQEEEHLGLQYFGARWYDPNTGRFTSIDPASELNYVESNPMMFNRYAYANNNPYRYVDPDGRLPLDTIWDAANVVYDIGKITVGWTTGNHTMVVEGGADLLLDSAALFTPYLPAGSSKVLGAANKYGPADPPVRISGDWSVNDLKAALLGHPPKGLGKPDLHHADQMPGSGIHEVLPDAHRGNKELHPNKFNQGVTPEMREADRKLHWWYRAREQGADQILPNWIYDKKG